MSTMTAKKWITWGQSTLWLFPRHSHWATICFGRKGGFQGYHPRWGFGWLPKSTEWRMSLGRLRIGGDAEKTKQFARAAASAALTIILVALFVYFTGITR